MARAFVTRLVQDGDRKCFMLLWMVTQRVRLERQWIISKSLFVQIVFFFRHAVWLSFKKTLEFLKDLTKVTHFLLPFCSFSFQSFYFSSELLPFVGYFSDFVISVLVFLFPVCSPLCSVFFSFRGLQFVGQKRLFSQWPELTTNIKSFPFSFLIYQSQWVWRYNSPV